VYTGLHLSVGSMRFSSSLFLSLATTRAITTTFVYATISNNTNISGKASAFAATSASNISQRLYSTSLSSEAASVSGGMSSSSPPPIDVEYPGTAVRRMLAVRSRVASLTQQELSGPWEDVRRKILWAGGLRDLPCAVPGQGYTGHSFNDYNHVDLTCMVDDVSHNENDGSVAKIAIGNQLGPGIRTASLPELGPGGSWSTCAIGCNQDPPRDVAHVQFRARIAFKLVWCPTDAFDAFVLVDDSGEELARGRPTGELPSLRERQVNYKIVMGSKYAKVADEVARLANISKEGLESQ
jgi:hypothetical protein